MNEPTEDQKTLYSLANTISLTRDEIDGMRVVIKAMAALLSKNPDLQRKFAEELKTASETEMAMSLNSPMSDAQLERRAAWIAKLVQPHVQPSA